jgi:Cu/Ag efflux protein CusF
VKRLGPLAFSLLLCTGSVAFAQESMKSDQGMKSSTKTMMCKGTITKMDKDGKTMTVKEASGKEMTCNWDDSTKVTGELKEGAMVSAKCTMQGDKMMVKEVKVMKSKSKM